MLIFVSYRTFLVHFGDISIWSRHVAYFCETQCPAYNTQGNSKRARYVTAVVRCGI